jgi:hypothetical protein
MQLRGQFGTVGAFLLAGTMLVASAGAQVVNSAAKPISLNAVLDQSLTVNLSGNAVNFNLVAGSPNNPGSTSITATTSWVLNELIGFVNVYAFFGTSTAALTDGAGHNIPSADFQISNNGGAFSALTNNTPFGGANAGTNLGSTLIFLFNTRGSRTDTMKFNINLSPLPALPPGNYTGTLTIQAQAF